MAIRTLSRKPKPAPKPKAAEDQRADRRREVGDVRARAHHHRAPGRRGVHRRRHDREALRRRHGRDAVRRHQRRQGHARRHLRPRSSPRCARRETRAAAKVLGVKRCIFWGMPDGFLTDDHELRGMVVQLIRELQPDLVLTWDGFRPGFNHTDHRDDRPRGARRALPGGARPALLRRASRATASARTAPPSCCSPARTSRTSTSTSARTWTRRSTSILCHTSQIDGRTRDEIMKGWLQAGKRDKERTQAHRIRPRGVVPAYRIQEAARRARDAAAEEEALATRAGSSSNWNHWPTTPSSRRTCSRSWRRPRTSRCRSGRASRIAPPRRRPAPA